MNLESFKVLCRDKSEGDWEHIAVAAGDMDSILRSRKILCLSELYKGWDSNLIQSRSDLVDRVFSSSVSDLSYLASLWSEIESSPLENSFLETVYCELKALFNPAPVLALQEKWE